MDGCAKQTCYVEPQHALFTMCPIDTYIVIFQSGFPKASIMGAYMLFLNGR